MQHLKLKPDDVLKGIGTYRDSIVVVCPSCGEEKTVERSADEVECDCGETVRLEKPFS